MLLLTDGGGQRQLQNPGRRNDGLPMGAQRAGLGQGRKGVTILFVVVGNFAPRARDGLDFLRDNSSWWKECDDE